MKKDSNDIVYGPWPHPPAKCCLAAGSFLGRAAVAAATGVLVGGTQVAAAGPGSDKAGHRPTSASSRLIRNRVESGPARAGSPTKQNNPTNGDESSLRDEVRELHEGVCRTMRWVRYNFCLGIVDASDFNRRAGRL
jgi:hypothetical protein